MTEQEHTHTPQHDDDRSPAALPHLLACARCSGRIWRAATLDEGSIVYHCVECGAGMRITYDPATRSWTAAAL